MSELTFQGDASARGDWSQVYTNLDWVARWMADRGYTDGEIAYVVARPVTPAVAAEAVLAPVEVPVEAVEAVETGEPVWTIPLTVLEMDNAPDESAVADPVDTDDPESTERVPA